MVEGAQTKRWRPAAATEPSSRLESVQRLLVATVIAPALLLLPMRGLAVALDDWRIGFTPDVTSSSADPGRARARRALIEALRDEPGRVTANAGSLNRTPGSTPPAHRAPSPAPRWPSARPWPDRG